MPVNLISSDSVIENTEQHFKISAGPGAGKTHWLVKHIKHVLNNSKRLSKCRVIACITYTNIAVETILGRLGTSSDQVEVSTIHSFLYKHIVKPYVLFIADEYGLNLEKMDGHDETILSNYLLLGELKKNTGQFHIKNNLELVQAISKARWKFEETTLVCKPNYPMRVEGYYLKRETYDEYKQLAWQKGILHHDDVLYFSYKLVGKYPFILDVLRAKFPYFFVDEFQDTNQIQSEILQKIGQVGTIVGVIGDMAQSIYGFQGAEPSRFKSFELPRLIHYQINDNRRSSNEIVQVLNDIRTDIQQISETGPTMIRPMVIVGSMLESLRCAKEECMGEVLYSLSRDNITSNAMKREINGESLDHLLFEELLETDSNKYRSKVVISCIKAIELAFEKKFKPSIRELEKVFKNISDKNTRKREAVNRIHFFMKRYDEYKDGSLINFCTIVKTNVSHDISGFRNGAPKTFYENHTYQQMSLCVPIIEDTSLHKTIHKAKGDEFDNVLLILKKESDLNFLINPDLDEKEEHRVNYVAISRAKKRLFISVPSLQEAYQIKLSDKFDIKNL